MNNQELLQIINNDCEASNIEYMISVFWNSPSIKSKLIKSILDFCNIKNGNFIDIGADQNG